MTDTLTLPLRECTGRNCQEQIADVVLVRKDGARVRHVFDPEPVAGGQYRIEANLLGELEAHHDGSLSVGYVSHFATCPNAAHFRSTT